VRLSAVMTHCRLAPEKRRPAWACGSAMFTIVASQNDHQLLIATPILAVASECDVVTPPPLLRHLAVEPAGLVHASRMSSPGGHPRSGSTTPSWTARGLPRSRSRPLARDRGLPSAFGSASTSHSRCRSPGVPGLPPDDGRAGSDSAGESRPATGRQASLGLVFGRGRSGADRQWVAGQERHQGHGQRSGILHLQGVVRS
jgi:hypothetical protein